MRRQNAKGQDEEYTIVPAGFAQVSRVGVVSGTWATLCYCDGAKTPQLRLLVHYPKRTGYLILYPNENSLPLTDGQRLCKLYHKLALLMSNLLFDDVFGCDGACAFPIHGDHQMCNIQAFRQLCTV